MGTYKIALTTNGVGAVDIQKWRWHGITALIGIGMFTGFAGLFFAALGKPPFELMWMLVQFSFGDGYSISQTLARTSPILLCALAAAIPGRLGLISVGAEGQLHVGAIAGTAVVLVGYDWGAEILLPATLIAAAVGGGLYGYLPGLLRARLAINETIVSLVLNYIAVLWVSALVYGAWRDPASQGWPATAAFPATAQLPRWQQSDVHLGLFLGVLAALLTHYFFSRSRYALPIRILAGNRKVGETFGLNFNFWVVLLMAIGGAVAGLAGIIETSLIQGRLQPSISLGFGLTGFLVSWLSRHQPLIIIPVSVLVGALVAGSDALQLFAKVPAASAIILQGLLFATALLVPAVMRQLRRYYGR